MPFLSRARRDVLEAIDRCQPLAYGPTLQKDLAGAYSLGRIYVTSQWLEQHGFVRARDELTPPTSTQGRMMRHHRTLFTLTDKGRQALRPQGSR